MTYEIIDNDSKPTITYTGGQFDGLIEAYYGTVRDGYVNINAPNWLGVEQSLRYSSAFSRRKEADPNDFSIFLATLINGKSGDASEMALAYAFGILGIVWTEPEMDLINKILKDNNFTIQLTAKP